MMMPISTRPDLSPSTPPSFIFRKTSGATPFSNYPRPNRSAICWTRRGAASSFTPAKRNYTRTHRKIRLADGVSRITALIECLSAFAASDSLQLLSSIGFRPDFSESENDRINAIYDYTFRHFTEKIYLDQVAVIAGLVPNSFCRYFKSRTGKTYTQFLTEIRIGHACKLLLDNRMSIKQLCFESGFSNFTSFHKNFRLITGKTPQPIKTNTASPNATTCPSRIQPLAPHESNPLPLTNPTPCPSRIPS